MQNNESFGERNQANEKVHKTKQQWELEVGWNEQMQ